MNKTLVSLLFVLVMLLVLSPELDAQCAMCKQVAEDATADGGNAAGLGLNNGIKYLLVIPYILFGIFITVFFRRKR